MVKLAVGIRNIAHLRAVQAQRVQTNPPLRHQTRNSPRRADEITEAGSLYWVIAGAIVVRQRITDIRPDQWDDGTACAALVLAPTLVPVAATPMRAFQGWRYLAAESAPPDIDPSHADAGNDMPEAMRRALQTLGLL